MPIHEDKLNDDHTVETSSGAWSGTAGPVNGLLKGIRVSPDTASTIYTLTITDRDGFKIYTKKGIRGDLVEDDVGIPVNGTMTVALSQATNDEPFSIKLMFSETV